MFVLDSVKLLTVGRKSRNITQIREVILHNNRSYGQRGKNANKSTLKKKKKKGYLSKCSQLIPNYLP